jgi:hypothetical protein
MDRVCRFIGVSHPIYKTNDIIEIQNGGDNNRKPHYTDDEWEALKVSRLNTLKQNALGLDYDGRKLTEAELQVRWEDASGSHNADYETQINDYDESLKTYVEKRKREYPSFGDQLDYIFHNGLDKWKADMILPIKGRYPKP